jgi:thiamine-phosphate pyrophosphorylase
VRPGVDLLRRARVELDCPIVAIGGITLATAAILCEAGADAVAIITDLFSAPDIGARVRDYGCLFERGTIHG